MVNLTRHLRDGTVVAVVGAVCALALAPAMFAVAGGRVDAVPTSTTTASPTTANLVLERSTPRACSADVIGTDVGMALRPEVVCSAGFAIALRAGSEAECDRVDTCDVVEVFHVTTSGWVHDGRHNRNCAENLGVIFISPQSAATFAPVCEPGTWPVPDTVQRGDRGVAVMYVQIALVALGYPLGIDGTLGAETQAAVRDFQGLNALSVDGIVGPQTHALLGTGPNPPRPTTGILEPGPARECSAAVVNADTGVALVGEPSCRAGWAVITPPGCGTDPEYPDAQCEDFDVFHLSADGWVHDNTRYSGCAEVLSEAGMSPYTALTWAPWCNGAPPARTDIQPASTGARVTQLQIALVGLGYPIAVDGTYGPRTQAAVRDFQQRSHLAPDGICGPTTQEALGI